MTMSDLSQSLTGRPGEGPSRLLDYAYTYQESMQSIRKAIEPSAPEKAKRKTKAEKEKEARERKERLETIHTRRLLELESARDTHARYQQVHRLTTLLIAWSSIVVTLSLIGVIVGFDNAWVTLLIGIVGGIVATITKVRWYETHKLRRDRHAMTDGFVTVDYLDPALNVKLAEAKYSQALRELTEET